MKRLLPLFFIVAISSCGSSNTDSSTSVAVTQAPTTETTLLVEPDVLLANCSGKTSMDALDSFDASGWAGQARPTEIYPGLLSPCTQNGCGDKIEVYEWTTWSSDVASGKGRWGANTFEPDACSENYEWHDIVITLDTPIDGYFTQMHCDYCSMKYVGPVNPRQLSMIERESAGAPGCEDFSWGGALPFKECQSSPFIQFIQNQLSVLGYAISYNTGEFGDETWYAVMQFQIDRRIEQDEGVVGLATWRELFKGVGLPGHDLNNDGLITPNEIVFD